jgi:hypothetical protein
MDDPIRLFAVIVLISLPTVMYGGYSLLRLATADRLSAAFASLFLAYGLAVSTRFSGI